MTIVYQDERIVVAVKPNGVLSTDEPGGIPSLLRQTLGTDCIRTVHRLDAQTGGLMVFARSRKAAALLSEQVRERQFSKGYLAVVHGVPQPPAGQLRDLLGRDSVRRVTFVADTPSAETREALLDYETLDSSGSLSLVQVHLHTGRTHQIRVHFASIGHPLAGDDLYGGRRDRIGRQALHCAKQTFRVPEYTEVPDGICIRTPVSAGTGRTVTVESPLPQDMKQLFGEK